MKSKCEIVVHRGFDYRNAQQVPASQRHGEAIVPTFIDRRAPLHARTRRGDQRGPMASLSFSALPRHGSVGGLSHNAAPRWLPMTRRPGMETVVCPQFSGHAPAVRRLLGRNDASASSVNERLTTLGASLPLMIREGFCRGGG